MKSIWNAKCNVWESLFEYLQNYFKFNDVEDRLKKSRAEHPEKEKDGLVSLLLKFNNKYSVYGYTINP